ncbi:MAG: hypothetical protein OXH85_05925 [Truepera sp.]|nr:hypothetical protein [Truepera sp.]
MLGFNALNDYVAEFYQRALERLIGLTCADSHDSHDHDALGKLKDCMHNLGLWADGRWMATEVAQILSARFIS